MKGYSTIFRIWIAVVSIFSFLAGWILFAHSNKPASILPNSSNNNQASQSSQSGSGGQFAPIPTLPPLNSFNNNNSNNSGFGFFGGSQTTQNSAPQGFFQPRLRSGGS